MGELFIGINYAWTSPSLSRIMSDEYPFEITSKEASYIAIVGPLGDVLGTILSWSIMHFFGRKLSTFYIGLINIASMLMIYLSFHSKIFLYTGRLFGGIGEGICVTVMLIYLCKICEPEIPSSLGIAFFLNLITGMLIGNVIRSLFGIYTSALVSLILNLVFIILFFCMPESPYLFLRKNKTEDARVSLRRIENFNLIQEVELQMSENVSFEELFSTKSTRKGFIIMITLRILQPYSGLTSLSYYAQILFAEVTDATPQRYTTILMITLEILSAITALVIVDSIRPRTLLLLSTAGFCLTLTTAGVLFYLLQILFFEVSNFSLLPLMYIMIFIISYSFGLGWVVNLLSGELSSASAKAKAAGITTLSYSFGMLTSAKFYQYTSGSYSLAIPFFIGSAILFLGFIITERFLPEPKNNALKPIQELTIM